MNMILHNTPTALIEHGNTLADPKFKAGDTLKTFDYVVANPPFSDKCWSTGIDRACDLVPKSLIVARYFAAEQKAVAGLEAELESITAQITELEEEHGGEEDAFSEPDKVNKATVIAHLKEIKEDEEAKEESAWPGTRTSNGAAGKNSRRPS